MTVLFTGIMRMDKVLKAFEAREEAVEERYSEEGEEAEAEDLGKSTRHTKSFRGTSPIKYVVNSFNVL
jgi:hypothetical protein